MFVGPKNSYQWFLFTLLLLLLLLLLLFLNFVILRGVYTCEPEAYLVLQMQRYTSVTPICFQFFQ